MYKRVLPRDLFNEAKLLKCLGKLSLTAFEPNPYDLHFVQVKDSFVIDQDPSSGCLFCSSVKFFVGPHCLDLQTIYNSKENYPLFCICNDEEEIEVFNEDGSFSQEFIKYMESLKTPA